MADRKFRVVDGSDMPPDAPPCPIADQIRALAELAISSGAVTAFVAWENETGQYGMQAVPSASSVMAGHAYALRQWLEEAYGMEE